MYKTQLEVASIDEIFALFILFYFEQKTQTL